MRELSFAVLMTVLATLVLAGPASASSAKQRSVGSGVGATAAQMRAAHGVSYIRDGMCSAPPHCFGPRIQNKEGTGYQFTGDMFQDGLLTAYTQNFSSNTSLANAEAQVLKWLPSDSQMGRLTI